MIKLLVEAQFESAYHRGVLLRKTCLIDQPAFWEIVMSNKPEKNYMETL